MVAAAGLLVAPPAAAAYPMPGHVSGDTSIHDPSLLVRPMLAPKYVLFGTGNATRTSTDRIQFSGAGQALAPQAWWHFFAATPYFGTATYWAPDVSVHDGKYWMYYAVSTFGSQESAIGLATSSSGDPGTFVDRGIVFESFRGDPYNAIDPNLMVDASGRWWLTFGSGTHGIYTMEVSPATGMPSGVPFLHHLAERKGVPYDPIEAPVLFRHGGYYYLFVSVDFCCHGADSTYSVRVGRSASPSGPYYGPDGVSLLDDGGGLVLASHDNVRGPGGQSVVHDSDHDLLIYHYYDAKRNGAPFLGIDYLGWTADGWPYVW
jgi:arabinan endo-1,5-alpha-L-arabinosidase